MIRTYDSITALSREAQVRGKSSNLPSDPRWFGYETFDQSISLSIQGNTDLVPEAEAMIDKLSFQIETPRRTWERSPVGVFCAVPDVLAGLPTPMRRQVQVGDEHQPISIFVRPNSHAAVTVDMLRRRGTVILALVLALARNRPISLYYFFVGDGRMDESVLCARIETAPLNLAQACYTLSSAGFYRGVCMSLATHLNDFRGGVVISDARGEVICHDEMGNDPKSTLVIGAARIDDPLIENPIPWLQAQITRFTKDTDA